jgi:hypothetical protein
MFDWWLMITLILICLPGLLISTPRLIASLEKTIVANVKPGQSLPPRPVLVAISVAQNLLIVAVAAAIGVATSPRTELDAPLIKGIAAGNILVEDATATGFAALFTVTPATLLFLIAYYRFLRPRFDRQTVISIESLRRALGTWSRLLFGGIVEEVILRWGLMGLFVWLGSLSAKAPTPAVIWTAIFLTGILFGLSHLPSHYAAGAQKTPLVVGAIIGSNLWLSLVFGWLFWQHGLLAAMVGHMLFHLIWLPFEQPHFRRLELS